VRTTLRSWLGRKAFYGTGSAALARRHGDVLAPAVLSPTYAAAAAALLLRNRWSLPVAAVSLAFGARAVDRALPDTPYRARLAGMLALRGLGWAVRQESALLLRHWWPAGIVGALTSRNVRRLIVSALAIDAAVGLTQHHHQANGLNPAQLMLGRRLDDAAYGAGLWWGAITAGSWKALLVRAPGRGVVRGSHRPAN
jgi:hypothetical protein